MGEVFNDFTMKVLSKSLDASALNHSLISNNIANVNTPGYKRSEVVFKDSLRAILRNKKEVSGLITHPAHIPIGFSPQAIDQLEPDIVVDRETTMRGDLNNVDIDIEMARLAQNSIEYSILSYLAKERLTHIRMAIEGR